jgi:hypothetical protein
MATSLKEEQTNTLKKTHFNPSENDPLIYRKPQKMSKKDGGFIFRAFAVHLHVSA